MEELKTPGSKVDDQTLLKLTSTQVPSKYADQVEKYNTALKDLAGA